MTPRWSPIPLLYTFAILVAAVAAVQRGLNWWWVLFCVVVAYLCRKELIA